MKPLSIQSQYNEQARVQTTKTAQIIPPTPLTTTITTLYTAPDQADFLVERLWIASVAAGAVTYSIYIVPSGGSASVSNAIAYEVSVAAKEFGGVSEQQIFRMLPGDSLQVEASANTSLNFGGWGYEIQSET